MLDTETYSFTENTPTRHTVTRTSDKTVLGTVTLNKRFVQLRGTDELQPQEVCTWWPELDDDIRFIDIVEQLPLRTDAAIWLDAHHRAVTAVYAEGAQVRFRASLGTTHTGDFVARSADGRTLVLRVKGRNEVVSITQIAEAFLRNGEIYPFA